MFAKLFLIIPVVFVQFGCDKILETVNLKIDNSDKIFIAGSSGMVGSAIKRKLLNYKTTTTLEESVKKTREWIEKNKPHYPVVTILCDRGERYFSIL